MALNRHLSPALTIRNYISQIPHMLDLGLEFMSLSMSNTMTMEVSTAHLIPRPTMGHPGRVEMPTSVRAVVTKTSLNQGQGTLGLWSQGHLSVDVKPMKSLSEALQGGLDTCQIVIGSQLDLRGHAVGMMQPPPGHLAWPPDHGHLASCSPRLTPGPDRPLGRCRWPWWPGSSCWVGRTLQVNR